MSSNDFIKDRLRVKLLAFPAAELSVFDKAKKKYMGLFNPEEMEFVNDKPDVLMFLTGGSEHIAIESVQEYRFYLLLASREANAWAAATEVKAWMNQHNIRSVLLDADNPSTAEYLSEYYNAFVGVRKLHGQRLGVVGSSSPWLVASGVNPFYKASWGLSRLILAGMILFLMRYRRFRRTLPRFLAWPRTGWSSLRAVRYTRGLPHLFRFTGLTPWPWNVFRWLIKPAIPPAWHWPS